MNGLFGGGDGTASNPFLVEDAADLQEVRSNSMAYYRQMKDIKVNNTFDSIDYFNGVYDGNGRVILDIGVGKVDSFRGLFVECELATLKNITIVNAVLNAPNRSSAGILAAEIYGCTIENCKTQGIISANEERAYDIGGLIGYVEEYWGSESVRPSIVNCSSDVDINITSEIAYNIGGLLGCVYYSDVIRNCSSTGSVRCDNSNDTGGLIGYVDDVNLISNCYSNCNVKGEFNVGGLIAYTNDVRIENCYATGRLTGINDVGGLIGYADDTAFISCYYDSQTSGQSDTGKGTPKTTAEMKQQATFIGWDFNNVWRIDENNDYPRFRWEPIKCTAFPLNMLKVNVIN